MSRTKSLPPLEQMLYPSPCGSLVLIACGHHLCCCDWIDGLSHVRLLKRLGQPCRQVSKSANSPFLSEVATQLDEYFSGARHLFSLPLMAVGTDFQKDVWYALATIPYGTTCSYTSVTYAVGRPSAVRAVARAIGANPLQIIVPCHRVVGSDGRLTGYAGGLERKKYLLDLEARHRLVHGDLAQLE